MLERQAVQKLHGDERLPVLLADLINGADVGMVQRRCSLRLALKAGQRMRVSGNVIREKLEGDEAMQPRVFSFVVHAHPATTEIFDDAIVRDSLADHLRKNLTSAKRASQ